MQRLRAWGLPAMVDAQLRAAVVLSGIAESRLLAAGVRVATREPQLVDTQVSDVPALIVRPGHGRACPALVFLNGVTEEGRRHPRVQRVALGLARAGLLVCVPDPPGLAHGPIDRRTLEGAVAVVAAIDGREDVNGVGLAGVSIGATLALLVAEEPDLAERLTVVAGIAPHIDFVSALLRPVTDREASEFRARLVAQSVLAALPTDMGSGAFEPLPDDVRSYLEQVSPLTHAERLRAPVELAMPRLDKYVPLADAQALARAATHTRVRVTVTSALDHSAPKLTLRELGELIRFDAWLVRSLRAACRP